jgi:hypothetical protein
VAIKESEHEKTLKVRRTRHLWRNPISLLGLALVVLSSAFFLSLEFFDLISELHNPYLSIWEWLVFAPTFVLGAVLIPVGVVITRWYWLRSGVDVVDLIRYPRIDLTRRAHRKVLIIFILCTIIAIPLIGLASSKTVHYSSSSHFCGNGCHHVMGPQFTRYQHSPHSKVECADCHIGAGTSSLIKAKLNGLRQVISVVTKSYPQPVPPATTILPPAKETCENCHWPEKQIGNRYLNSFSYRADESNSIRETSMIIKVGGADPETGPSSGVHWHMSLGSEIEYLASEEDLQEIPWVRWHDPKSGQTRIFRSDGIQGTEAPKNGILRKFDCLDCHNRGAHNVESPSHLIDIGLESGSIDRKLPFIKREALAALSAVYSSNEQAQIEIPKRINSFYQINYPEIFSSQQASLNRSLAQLLSLFQENFFIEMKVDWRSYPNNIGHKIFPGCFRCHDDKHVSQDGGKITRDCNVCHEFISSKTSDGVQVSGKFEHAILLDRGIHAEVNCHQCHTGGTEPTNQCNGACHQSQQSFATAENPLFKRFEIQPDDMSDEVTCNECHLAENQVNKENIRKECIRCHEDDDDDYGKTFTKWEEKLSTHRADADKNLNRLTFIIANLAPESSAVKKTRLWIEDANTVLAELTKAGPFHNVGAAKKIYRTITAEAQEQIETFEQSSSTDSN